MLDIFTICVV